MTFDLSGQTALVTGGGVGIGRGIALALAEAGAAVAITHHHHDASTVIDRIRSAGGEAYDFKLDATNSGDVETVVTEAATRLGGKINFLVNNSGGLLARVPIDEMPDAHWHQVIDLNLSSSFYCIRSVLRHMPDGGHIVSISSLAAKTGGGGGAAAYAAAKAGLEGLTRAVAKGVAGRKILVNCVAPGFILDTPFHETFTPPEVQEATAAALPVGRAGYPADVAQAVLFLLSSASSFCTGITLDVSGGAY
jgi:3-oxoacyl-[acyl-carrier protein] reductase